MDILWDAIHAANATPIVELSFMPSLLANCSWDGDHDAGWIPGSHNITRPGAPKCSQSLFYGGVMMPPVVWADWYHLVRALVEHAVSRYGIEEVRDNWAFEVWNGKFHSKLRMSDAPKHCMSPLFNRWCDTWRAGRAVGHEFPGTVYDPVQS